MTNLLWFFALILIAGGNGFGGLFGGNRPVGPAPASLEDSFLGQVQAHLHPQPQ